MKIQKLSVKNFLALESVEMDLSEAPIHICVGPNEAGKSSLRDSISWALTGQCRGLKTHQEQALLINESGKAAEVTVTFADGRKIIRRKTPKSPPQVEGALPDDLGLTMALCDSHHFLALPEKDRRAELFRLIPGLNPRRDEVRARLIVSLKELTGSLSPQMDSDILNLANIAEQKSFKDAENEAVTRRRMAKRVRDELHAQEPEQRITIQGREFILPDIKAQQVDENLAKLYTERDKLLKKQGKAEGELDKLPDLEAELAALVVPDPPEEGEIKEWEEALDINRPILDKLRQDVAGLEQGKPARKFPALCPACEVGCPSSGKEAVPAVPPADPAKAEKLKADLQEQIEQVARLEEGLGGARQKQSAHDEALKRKTALESQIASLKDQQARAEETATFQAEIDALASRISLGEELRDRVREFWRKQKEAEAAAAKIEATEREVTLYDTLTKALAPEGIPSQLIAEALGPVNDLLALASSFLFPGRSFALTQDLEIMLSGSPFSTLSKSARFRVGVAFQYALAKLAGARLLLIDEADLLDSPNRSQLIDFLLTIQKDFETIMVFSTVSDCPSPSPIPEIQIWWLEDGKVSRVMGNKAA